MKINKECYYCELLFKNDHGLKIHHHYCLVKKFAETPLLHTDSENYGKLLQNSYFVPVTRWPKTFVKFFVKDEVGLFGNNRIVLDTVRYS